MVCLISGSLLSVVASSQCLQHGLQAIVTSRRWVADKAVAATLLLAESEGVAVTTALELERFTLSA